ncbi:UPF0481 protein-like protein [Tanacetum coccineum]
MAEVEMELMHYVDIDQTVQLLLNYDESVQNRSKQRPGSIYMVPSIYRDLSPRSFTPRLVSIGPLHHHDEHLKGFEVQKATYMHHLFHKVLHSLGSTPEQLMKACVTRVSRSIDLIKECYIGMKTYPDSKLVKMMVTDACFILAFINNFAKPDSSLGENVLLYSHIFLDMVLIENQIPFFVLEDIYECTFSKLLPTRTLANFILVIQETCKIFEGDLALNNTRISSIHDHILGFLHEYYQNPDGHSSTVPKMVKGQSVVELDRLGVRFRAKTYQNPHGHAKWPMAMKIDYVPVLCFPLSWVKPTFEMPVLRIHDHSELFIRNLIIYEQSSKVQTCSDEEAAGVINNICKEVTIRDFYYGNEWKTLDEYNNGYWAKLIAGLRRRYFSNPWSIIALIAGIVLFVLTVIQTVYGVKSA